LPLGRVTINPYIKTTLSPGSGVVTKYLELSGTLPYLEKLGFCVAGYGCMTCIGNSGDLPDAVSEVITKNDIVAASVLSGNRNFEGRVHNLVRSNFLASPPLVVAYALAGTVNIDFEKEPIGHDKDGKPVFFSELWPTKDEVSKVVSTVVKPQMFTDVYNKIINGTEQWNALEIKETPLYEWNNESTYIKRPPFFDKIKTPSSTFAPIVDAQCILNLGDSITTDHISPAGMISKTSVAARYLMSKGVEAKDFNQYGTRRGNFEVMARGTFANVRIVNKLVSEVGPKTLHIPTNTVMDIYDAVAHYKKDNTNLIVLAGKEYGSGSSRDWAAKGPMLMNIKTVIAESYERIHRSNLAGMGILPLEFSNGENAEKLGLTGKEKFTVHVPEELHVNQMIDVTTDCGKKFTVKARLDTEPEIEYYRDGGILIYVMKKLMH
jgi:aconitate hydratase